MGIFEGAQRLAESSRSMKKLKELTNRHSDTRAVGVVEQSPPGTDSCIHAQQAPSGVDRRLYGRSEAESRNSNRDGDPGGGVCRSGTAPGVVSIFAGGREAGHIWWLHPEVDLVAFTGSTAAGKAVMASAATRLARVSA